MSSRLVNVRLDEDRLGKVRQLRARGVALSDIVREAIDERFEQARGPRKPGDVEVLMARIFERHPDPSGRPPVAYDVFDRREARGAIRRKLRRRRR